MAVLTRKRILEALGSYQRTDALSIDLDAFAKSLADESDRGLVVALGSVIEDMLAGRLFQNFTRNDAGFRKDLVRPGSLLANATDKAKLALALGLIDERDADELEVLNAMRNACAHSRQGIDFTTPALKDAMTLLWRGPKAPELLQNVTSQTYLRVAFVVAVSYIASRIKGETPEETLKRVGELLRHFSMAAPPPASRQKQPSQSKKTGRTGRKDKGR